MVNLLASNIPIRDIPGSVGTPNKSTLVAMDNGITMQKTTVQAIVEAGRIVASQLEAEAGADNTNVMTALRVAQAIEAQGDNFYAVKGREINAGTGLAGGGTLEANRTIALNSTSIASLAKADSAVQPGDLSTVATSGDYADLSNKPTLGTAAAQDVSAFATAAQGAKADSALQSADIGTSVQGHSSLLDSVSGLSLTAGDLFVADGPASVTTLGKGTEGQVLGVVGGNLAYKSVPAVDLPSPPVANTVPVRKSDNSAYEAKPVGTTGLAVLGAETPDAARGILGVADYATRSEAMAATIIASQDYVRTAGYASAGDGGGALYKRVVSEPSHAGKFQSADGAWWELATDVANIRMFGAKGDGITDDAGAIQNAIGFAYATECGAVYIPNSENSYLIGATINVPATVPLVLKGNGMAFSGLQADTGVSPIIKLGDTAAYQGNPQRIEGLTFYPENVAVVAEAIPLEIYSCRFENGSSGIILDEVWSFMIDACYFGNTEGVAVQAVTQGAGHNSVIRSSGFFGCGTVHSVPAINITHSDNVLLDQNQIEGCYTAFHLNGCTAVRVTSNYMEYGNAPFYLALSPIDGRRNSSIVIEGNWIAAYDNATYIEHVNGLFFRGNTIWNQVIGFGPAANSSGICVGQNTLNAGGVINDVPWELLTTINGWSAATNPPAVNATFDGQVSIRGAITRSTGSGNQVCFVLPEAYRPRTQKRFLANNDSGGTVITVADTNGNIYVEAGGSFSGTVYLDITFLR